MAATFLGFCDDTGHVALDDRAGFVQHIRAKFKGQEFIVTVKKRPRMQGTQQLRYLRGVVIPDIASACGYTDPDDWQSVYEGLMFKFFRLPDGPFGEPRREHCFERCDGHGPTGARDRHVHCVGRDEHSWLPRAPARGR